LLIKQLDVTNLFINSRNHGFDPAAWLRELDADRIVQLHVVGYSQSHGRWQDYHAKGIQETLMELVQEVLEWAPVRAIILERDANFPPPSELENELRRLRQLTEQCGTWSSCIIASASPGD
jgi:hypothetical protein